jgi:hypothetical protein
VTKTWAVRASVAGLGALSLAGYTAGFRSVSGRGSDGLQAYVVLCSGLFVVYLAALWLVFRHGSADRVLVAMAVGGGLLFRLALVDTPIVLSSDIYRYLWDGRVQSAGINPYRYPPAAEELRPLRDAQIHPQINRPTKRTVYPPGTEALYRVVFRLAPDSILGWRLFIIASEIATMALLLILLRRLRRPASSVIVYAWAPLVVFEGVQAGHVDFAIFPFILLALYWRQDDRMTLAGLALGAAVAMKLHPVVLLLAWRRRGERRLALACAAVVAAAYLAYLPGAGSHIAGFLPEYFGSAEDFNVGLRFFLTEAIGLDGEVARGTVMLILGIVLLAVLLRLSVAMGEDRVTLLRRGMAAVAAYLVLAPTAMHAWYAAWILPFVTLRPSSAWLWWSGAVTLSYLKYAWDPAGLPLWTRALEYLPLYALLMWEWARDRFSPAAVAPSEAMVARGVPNSP